MFEKKEFVEFHTGLWALYLIAPTSWPRERPDQNFFQKCELGGNGPPCPRPKSVWYKPRFLHNNIVCFRSPGEMNQKLMQTASYRQQEAANRAIHLKVLRMLDESSEPHSIDVNLVELQSPLSEVIIESFWSQTQPPQQTFSVIYPPPPPSRVINLCVNKVCSSMTLVHSFSSIGFNQPTRIPRDHNPILLKPTQPQSSSFFLIHCQYPSKSLQHLSSENKER